MARVVARSVLKLKSAEIVPRPAWRAWCGRRAATSPRTSRATSARTPICIRLWRKTPASPCVRPAPSSTRVARGLWATCSWLYGLSSVDAEPAAARARLARGALAATRRAATRACIAGAAPAAARAPAWSASRTPSPSCVRVSSGPADTARGALFKWRGAFRREHVRRHRHAAQAVRRPADHAGAHVRLARLRGIHS